MTKLAGNSLSTEILITPMIPRSKVSSQPEYTQERIHLCRAGARCAEQGVDFCMGQIHRQHLGAAAELIHLCGKGPDLRARDPGSPAGCNMTQICALQEVLT